MANHIKSCPLVVPTTVILEHKSEHVIAWTQPAASKEIPPYAVGDQISLPVGIASRSYLDRFAPVATVTDVCWAFNHHIVTLEAVASEPVRFAPPKPATEAPAVTEIHAPIESPPGIARAESAPAPTGIDRVDSIGRVERAPVFATRETVQHRRRTRFRRLLARTLQRSARWSA